MPLIFVHSAVHSGVDSGRVAPVLPLPRKALEARLAGGSIHKKRFARFTSFPTLAPFRDRPLA
jgi:hypothetical protein